MTYNERHRHSRDEHLTFEPQTHTYHVDGCVFDSVTTVVESCFEQFDAEYWAERKATPEHPKDKILEEWKAKGKEARNLGTELHDRIERYYLGKEVQKEWLADRAFQHFASFACDVRLCPFRSEWRIYHEESRLAGTLDFLDLHSDGSVEIWDWKRSNKVVNQAGKALDHNKYGKKAFSPLNHLPDTTFHHYAFQVSIYRYILETKYKFTVTGAKLGVFHPDYSNYFTVEVPYLKKEVELLLNHRISTLKQ